MLRKWKLLESYHTVSFMAVSGNREVKRALIAYANPPWRKDTRGHDLNFSREGRDPNADTNTRRRESKGELYINDAKMPSINSSKDAVRR